MIKKTVVFATSLCIAAAVFCGAASAQSARDYISIVGSSTVYPFATVVAEQFGKSTPFKTPTVESTGSGGGFKLFCAGVGVEHPDVTNCLAGASSKVRDRQPAPSNGVEEIVEIKIGYDGIVVANARKYRRAARSLDSQGSCGWRWRRTSRIPDGSERKPGRESLTRPGTRSIPSFRPSKSRCYGPAADLRHPRRLRGTGPGSRAAEAFDCR
jgi:hypothetical protein